MNNLILVNRHFSKSSIASNGHEGGTEYSGQEYFKVEDGVYLRLPCTKEQTNVLGDYSDAEIAAKIQNGTRAEIAAKVLFPRSGGDKRITVII